MNITNFVFIHKVVKWKRVTVVVKSRMFGTDDTFTGIPYWFNGALSIQKDNSVLSLNIQHYTDREDIVIFKSPNSFEMRTSEYIFTISEVLGNV